MTLMNGIWRKVHNIYKKRLRFHFFQPRTALILIICPLSLFACTYIETLQKPFFSYFSKPGPKKIEIKPYTISGQNIIDDALLASIVYETDDMIQSFCAENGYKKVNIGLVNEYEVKFFTAHKNGFQYIVVRGTSNYANVQSDIIASPVYDALSNIWLHKGFRDAAIAVFDHLQQSYPKINPKKKTIIIGHSLGGAIANILGIYLSKNDCCLDRIITFGQPKITNEKGLSSYSHLQLIRVVGEGDVIANVPPKTDFFTYTHGGFKISINDTSMEYATLGDPFNNKDDDPVDLQMNLARLSHAANHKISNYIQRLEKHKNKIISVQ